MNRFFLKAVLLVILAFTGFDGYTQITKYLSGVYTIGGNGANYSSIQKAVSELTAQSTEVVGRVVFNIRPGTYDESVVFKPYNGASPRNFVVFKSETNRASDVIIRGQGLGTLYDNHVIRFEGTTYYTLQDVTIQNTKDVTQSNDFVSGIHVTYNRETFQPSQYNTITRCIIKVDSNFTVFSGTVWGIVFSDINNTSSPGNCAHYNTVNNNTIIGGAFGIKISGLSLAKPGKGNKITNNKIYKAYVGMEIDYNDIPAITGNIIQLRENPVDAQYGIRLRNFSGNINLSNNIISNFGTFGIFFNNVKGGAKAYIYNNIIYGKAKPAFSQGIHVVNSSNLQFYHNSISYSGPLGSDNTCFLVENSTGALPISKISIKNNIFYSTNGAAPVIVRNLSVIDTFNYNNYYNKTSSLLAVFGIATAIDKDKTSITAIRTATPGKNTASLSVNPDFPNDTTLRPNNPALIRTAYILPFILNDFENHPRDPEMPDFGADEVIRSAVDLEVFGLEKNFVPKEGQNILPVVIKNDGLLSLNGNVINISYKINNGAYTSPQQFTLTQLSKSYLKQVFKLTNNPWNIAAPGAYSLTIKVSPAVPNDLYNANDSIVLPICVGLSGTYTIGGPAGPRNYSDFTSAIAAFTCGVGAPTVFNVYPGTYTERIIFPVILGASEVNTVLFKSQTGNAADVIIVGTGTSQVRNHHVVQFNGSDYITFKNITLTNNMTGAFASGFSLINSADYVTIDSCVINLSNHAGITDRKIGVVASYPLGIDSSDKAGNHLTVRNSTIIGGSIGIQYKGLAGAERSLGISLINNSIDSSALYGINLQNVSITDVNNNKIRMKSSATATSSGIRVMGSRSNGRIMGNLTHNSGQKGIEIVTSEGVTELLIANNMITGGFKANDNGAGLYLNEVNKINVYNNSIYYDKTPTVSPTASSALYIGSGANITLYNNIFYNPAGGYVFYCATATAIRASDNNNFYADADPLNGNFAFLTGDRMNLNQLRLALPGYDVNSFEVDPLFVSNVDLHTLNPIFDGAGRHLDEITHDFDLQKRNPLRPDIGADEFILNPVDLALIEIDPIVFSTSPNTIKVKLFNEGSLSLAGQTIKLQYSADGSTWLNPAETLTFSAQDMLNPYDEYVYTFNSLFSVTPNTTYNFHIRIDPSQRIVGDAVSANDTIKDLICVGLNAGSYTVGGTSPDFATLSDAAAAITCGITGPVVFNIRNGIYNERFEIYRPRNTSDINTILFKSESGNRDAVIVKSTGTGTTTTRNVVRIDSAQYIVFDGITFDNNLNSVAGTSIFQIANFSKNITINNCKFLMDTVAAAPSPNVFAITTSAKSGLLTDGIGGSDLLISNNEFVGGASAIQLRGLNPYQRDNGIVIENNIIRKVASFGIFTNKVDVKRIYGNTITMREGLSSGTGINILIARDDIEMAHNRVYNTPSAAVSLTDIQSRLGSMFYNNMFGAGFKKDITGTCMSMSGVIGASLYYNSLNYDGISVNSATLRIDMECRGIRLLNNSVYNAGRGLSFIFEDAASIDTSDHNNFATKGSVFSKTLLADYLSLDEYRTEIPVDEQSISIDPDYFTDIDLRCTNAFLDGVALPIPEVTVDFFGEPRDSIFPDVGADEFFVQGDVRLVSINEPLSSNIYPGTVPVHVTLQNMGTSKLSGLSIKYWVDGVGEVAEVVVDALLPAQILDFEFDSLITPGASGVYDLKVEVFLPGDDGIDNVLTTTFFSSITDIVDGEITSIVKPVNTIREKQPVQVIIKNSGTITIENFSAGFYTTGGTVVETGYGVITGSIEPNESLFYTFDDSINCSTAPRYLYVYLDGVTDDLNPRNDTVNMILMPHGLCGDPIDTTKVGTGNIYEKGFTVSPAYPNPANTELNFNLMLLKQGTLRLQLVDVLGKVIREKEFSGLSTGIETIGINVSEVAPGIYYSVISLEGAVTTQRVVIAR